MPRSNRKTRRTGKANAEKSLPVASPAALKEELEARNAAFQQHPHYKAMTHQRRQAVKDSTPAWRPARNTQVRFRLVNYDPRLADPEGKNPSMSEVANYVFTCVIDDTTSEFHNRQFFLTYQVWPQSKDAQYPGDRGATRVRALLEAAESRVAVDETQWGRRAIDIICNDPPMIFTATMRLKRNVEEEEAYPSDWFLAGVRKVSSDVAQEIPPVEYLVAPPTVVAEDEYLEEETEETTLPLEEEEEEYDDSAFELTFGANTLNKGHERAIQDLAIALGINPSVVPDDMDDDWKTILILCGRKARVEGSFDSANKALGAVKEVVESPQYDPEVEQPA